MKRWVQRTTAGICAAVSLMGTTLAADFTHCAEALQAMELFTGTKHGYELDRAPTRAEAAAMLVRLLGREEDAKSKTYRTPFRDVPKWAAPYVGWLYENKLTVGMSATKFGTAELCNAQQYATFLLRALGYAEGDGYTYKTALDYAKTLGVIDAVNYDSSKKFLRDQMVAMSYTALSREVKTGDGMLLDTLIAEDSIDIKKAAHTKAIFDNNNAYAELKNRKQDRSDTLTAVIRAANGTELTYTGKIVRENGNLAAELRHADALIVGVYEKHGVQYLFTNGKTINHPVPAPNTIPVSAISDLTTKNDTYAYSFVPAVLNRTLKGAPLKQVSYSAKEENGSIGQQTARVQMDLTIGGKRDTYKIEMHVQPNEEQPSLFVPEGMEV